jgi:hypothetical protein
MLVEKIVNSDENSSLVENNNIIALSENNNTRNISIGSENNGKLIEDIREEIKKELLTHLKADLFTQLMAEINNQRIEIE